MILGLLEDLKGNYKWMVWPSQKYLFFESYIHMKSQTQTTKKHFNHLKVQLEE
jgi:hypothetical protein